VVDEGGGKEMSYNYEAFIPYVNRLDLYWRAQAACEFYRGRLWGVDNSPARDLAQDSFISLTPPVPLFFSQTMNFMIRFARECKADYLIWIHSDAAPASGSCEALVNMAERKLESGERHGTF
jgi:hypothetical protein